MGLGDGYCLFEPGQGAKQRMDVSLDAHLHRRGPAYRPAVGTRAGGRSVYRFTLLSDRPLCHPRLKLAPRGAPCADGERIVLPAAKSGDAMRSDRNLEFWLQPSRSTRVGGSMAPYFQPFFDWTAP